MTDLVPASFAVLLPETTEPTATPAGSIAARAVLNASQNAVVVTDAQIDEPGPRIEYVNDSYLRLFCCEESDVIGGSPRFAQGPLTNRGVLARLRLALETGVAVRAQAINYRFDGEAFRLRWTIDPIRETDRIVGYVGVLSDVTSEDRLRRRLTALDTLTTTFRDGFGADSDGGLDPAFVCRTFAAAVEPALAEYAAARVEIDGAAAERVVASDGSTVSPEAHEAVPVVPIGDIGRIHLDVHPDAVDLFDRDLVVELAAQTAWVVSLAGGLDR